MEPGRVRLYGLFPVTKRGYLYQVVAAAMLLAILILVRAGLPPKVAELAQSTELPWHYQVGLALLVNAHWIALGLAVLIGIEAFLVLRLFARKEAAAKAKPP